MHMHTHPKPISENSEIDIYPLSVNMGVIEMDFVYVVSVEEPYCYEEIIGIFQHEKDALILWNRLRQNYIDKYQRALSDATSPHLIDFHRGVIAMYRDLISYDECCNLTTPKIRRHQVHSSIDEAI
jgi:hypothetical protein